MVKIALGILLIANICRFLLATYGGTVQAMEYSTLTRLDPIGMGILVALLGDKLPRFSTWQRVALLSIGIGVWISVSAFCSPDRLDIANVWKLTLGLPLTALASVAILLSVIGSRHFLLRSKSLKYLGKISYGLYVVHMFALSLAARVIHGSTRLAIGTQVGFGLILAILLAAASYRWLESPFL